MTVDVVIVGHVGTETIRTPWGEASGLGGAAYHAAVGASRAGASAGVVSRVGAGYPVGEVSALGVDTTGLRVIDGPGSRFDIHYLPTLSDRAVSFSLGVGADLSVGDFPGAYRSTKLIHVATNLPETQLAMIRALRALTDAILTVDCFDQFIASDPATVRQVLRECDLYFANEDEQRLIDELGPIHTAHVVKRGAGGAEFHDEDHRIARVPAPRAEVVDPTGAGDVFAGAFLGYRARGLDVPSAMEGACRLAARSVEGFGSSLLAVPA
jgi:sugar/nucleoside kinase (ribokinase family)